MHSGHDAGPAGAAARGAEGVGARREEAWVHDEAGGDALFGVAACGGGQQTRQHTLSANLTESCARLSPLLDPRARPTHSDGEQFVGKDTAARILTGGPQPIAKEDVEKKGFGAFKTQ